MRDYHRHYSEIKNADIIAVCRATGLRRRELEHLSKDWLFFKDGKPYLCVKSGTKGGRYREIPVIGTDKEKEAVVQIIQSAPGPRVFPRINASIPIHTLRAEAATNYYNQLARPPETYQDERLLLRGSEVIAIYQTITGHPDKKRFHRFYRWDIDTSEWRLKPGYRDISSVLRCRDELKGVTLDRQACLQVSQFLGHNRDSIFPEHYHRIEGGELQ